MNRLRREDRGAALVSVIGIMLVFAVISVTVVSSSLFAAGTSTVTRAGVQTQAAAEQAVDQALLTLRTTARRGQEATFPCTIPYSITTATGTVDVDVDVEYLSEGAVNAGCPVASGVDLVGATLTANATHTTVTGQGSAEVDRAVRQVLDLPDPTVRPPLLGFGVFSGDDLDTTNNFRVIDGGVHTNGVFRCTSQAFIRGPVTAVGGASITNNCEMEGLWTGGNVGCSANALIDGDLTTTGTGTFSNTCTVTGNAVFGGQFSSGGWTWRPGYTKSVGGNLISATGLVKLSNTARIGGSVQAGGAITTDNGSAVSTVVAGSVIPNVPGPVPAAPEVQTMPAITWTDLTVYPGAPAPLDFKVWAQQNAVANGAPTWSDPYKGVTCTLDSATYSLNGGLKSPATPTILDARGCDVKLQNLDLVLQEDLTIVTRKFISTNGLRVTSTKAGDPAKLRIVVPLASGASTCSGVSTGEITFNSGGTTFANNVHVLLYTNGKVTLTNDVAMTGSVYGCDTSFSVNSWITYADMTPPDMDPPPSEYYEFEPDARYDLVGLP